MNKNTEPTESGIPKKDMRSTVMESPRIMTAR